MRDIKFRSWDKVKNKMEEWEFMKIHLVGSIFDLDGDYWEIMQYTGLKDENLTEIYEHDIIKYVDVDESVEIGVVEWDDLQLAWHFISKRSDYPMGSNFRGCGTKYEVIGNIYQNPELLKEEK